jgi:hypothetical protein
MHEASVPLIYANQQAQNRSSSEVTPCHMGDQPSFPKKLSGWGRLSHPPPGFFQDSEIQTKLSGLKINQRSARPHVRQATEDRISELF